MPCAEEEPRSEPGRRTRILWIKAFAYVAIVYSSVLQSFVVVPEIQYEDMFDDIVQKNFTLFAKNYLDVQERGQTAKERLHALKTANWKISANLDFLRREAAVGELVQPVELSYRNLSGLLLQLNPNNRKVLLANARQVRLFQKILKFLGQSVRIGKEKFFLSPEYWIFQMQKQWMLLKTLEHMKAAGLVYYFLDKTEGMYHNHWLNSVRSELELEKEASPDGGESENNDYYVGFSDSIISEGFFLFLYCTSACGTYWLLCSIVHLLWSRLGRIKALLGQLMGLLLTFERRRKSSPSIIAEIEPGKPNSL